MLHSVYLILFNAEKYKDIHDALSRSFVTSYYLFLFYCNYEITSYASPEKFSCFRSLYDFYFI